MYANRQKPIPKDLVDLSHVEGLWLRRDGAGKEADRLGHEAIKGEKESEEP